MSGAVLSSRISAADLMRHCPSLGFADNRLQLVADLSGGHR